MIKVTITETQFKTSSPDAAKPWKKLGIKTDKHGDKWLGCFVSKYNETQLSKLAPGQTVEIIVTQTDDGKYLNFSLPTRIDLLEARVAILEKASTGNKQTAVNEKFVEADDINPDDIPF